MRRAESIDLLHELKCSCVICNGEAVRTFNQRGVKDLLHLLDTEPQLLDGSFIADKVVGKGAAALMILGKVVDLHADVLSKPAAELLDREGIPYTFGQMVENIINRQGDGICPVESLCSECQTAQVCLPLIKNFIQGLR